MALHEITIFLIPALPHRPGNCIRAMSFLSGDCSSPFAPRRRGCFSPRFIVPNSRSIAKRTLWVAKRILRTPVVSFGGRIVFNCFDHPFFNKTPKSMPKIEKTIKQFITAPPRASPKQPRFLTFFDLFVVTRTLTFQYRSTASFCLRADIRFRALTKKSRRITFVSI
jgi:hypothetical protein